MSAITPDDVLAIANPKDHAPHQHLMTDNSREWIDGDISSMEWAGSNRKELPLDFREDPEEVIEELASGYATLVPEATERDKFPFVVPDTRIDPNGSVHVTTGRSDGIPDTGAVLTTLRNGRSGELDHAATTVAQLNVRGAPDVVNRDHLR